MHKIYLSANKITKKFGRNKKSSYLCTRKLQERDVAQPGRVRVWGACGRKFESCHPDSKEAPNIQLDIRCFVFFMPYHQANQRLWLSLP